MNDKVRERLIENTKLFVGTQPGITDELVKLYLDAAFDRILERLYPAGTTKVITVLPKRYQGLQCELAARMLMRRGSEGEMVHIEDGIHRHYSSADDADLLARITPYVGLLGV